MYVYIRVRGDVGIEGFEYYDLDFERFLILKESFGRVLGFLFFISFYLREGYL